jgi:hypothetical protein
MAEVTESEAIASARAQLRLGEHVAVDAWKVQRIDRTGESYWLVIFGERDAAVGAGAIDAQTGEVMVSASLPGTQKQLAVDAATALQIAGMPPGTPIRLAWKSCPASRSPLYPLWEIVGGNETIYVDQQAKLWRSLAGRDRGG